MNTAQRILQASAGTNMKRALEAISSTPPLRETNIVKSKGSPFGVHPEYGVLNRKTRRKLRSKRFAKKLKAGRV